MSEDQNEKIHFIVGGLPDLPKQFLSPGSKILSCYQCQSPTYISQSGQDGLKNNKNLQPLCFNCGKEKFFKDENPQINVLPGVIPELEDLVKKIKQYNAEKN